MTKSDKETACREPIFKWKMITIQRKGKDFDLNLSLKKPLYIYIYNMLHGLVYTLHVSTLYFFYFGIFFYGMKSYWMHDGNKHYGTLVAQNVEGVMQIIYIYISN